MRNYWRRIGALAAVLLVGIFMISLHTGDRSLALSTVASERNNATLSLSHRKLLRRVKPERIWDKMCSKSDIVVNQGQTAPLPNGIPTYTVEIMNTCDTGCNISGIHLSCGWFSSARLVNPHIFKRMRYNDCLVNNGKPLAIGHTLSFQYANTRSYPLSVSKVDC